MTLTDEAFNHLMRPLISLENRTPKEVFDIMCDRIRGAQQEARFKQAALHPSETAQRREGDRG